MYYCDGNYAQVKRERVLKLLIEWDYDGPTQAAGDLFFLTDLQ